MGLEPGDGCERCLFERQANRRRHAIRTTDLLKSLYVEERRRLTIVSNAFGEDAVLKLMSGATIRAAEHWRVIRGGQLECRQVRGVREELDHEFEALNGLEAKTSAPACHTEISSDSPT